MFTTMWSKIVVVFFVLVESLYAGHFILGPARTKILNFMQCPEVKNQTVILTLQPHMVNKTDQLVDVDLFLPFDLDDTIKMFLKASKIEKNKPPIQVFALNDMAACSTLNKYVGNLWFDFQSSIRMEPGVCPIKKGHYSTKNLYIDLTRIKIQLLLEGQFRTKFMLKDNGTFVFCANVENDLRPKK